MTTAGDDLERALRDAVADVEPRRGVEEVLARSGDTLRDRRGPRGWLVAATTVAAVLAVTGGVAWLNRPTDRPAGPASQGRDTSVQVYYLGSTANGPRLFVERHQLHAVAVSDAQAALDEALALPADPDYRSGFPEGTGAVLHDDGDRVTVDFTDASVLDAVPEDGGGAAALQALVWTLDAALNRQVGVTFAVEGKPVETILGEDVSSPLDAGTADDVLSPVSIDLPEGAQVRAGDVVTGHAAAFEGTVAWELRQGSQVVDEGFTTAAECCTLAPYAIRIQAEPGNYTLVVHDTDESDGEGNGTTADSKDITVVGEGN